MKLGDNMIYFTSDFHFNHNKDFIYKARGFDSVEAMNEAIIEKYNSIIRPDDDVYILGDIGLGGADAHQKNVLLCNRLMGHIHLVRGNHDTDTRWKSYYEECQWDLVEASAAIYLRYAKYHFYLSHYPALTTNFDDYKKPLQSRTLSISGHTHSIDFWNETRSYNVCVDAHDMMPVPIDDIIQAFKHIEV